MTRPAARRPRRTVAERPAARPPRDPERPPARPVDRALYRRRRRLALLLAGLVLVVGLGFAVRVLLYDSGLADVEDVQVLGASTVPAGDVLAVAAVQQRTPLAAVDTGGIAARVAALPAVASVDVGRSWPHTVTVTITERVPVATVDTTEGPALVDTTGVVYRAPAPAGLPRLEGPAATGAPATAAAVAVLTTLPDAVRTQVQTVRATVAVPGAPGQVTLGLTDDREVRWGAADRATEKGAVLVALLTQPGRVYDVTSPDLPTVRR
jgi:cell division protein FtsQ